MHKRLRYKDIYDSDTDSEENVPLKPLSINKMGSFSSDDDVPLSVFLRDSLNVDDYVLVKIFGRKNQCCHYVAVITSIEINNDYTVKYMRKSSQGHFFFFPDVDDIGLASNNDIVSILGKPRIKRGQHFFNVPSVINLS